MWKSFEVEHEGIIYGGKAWVRNKPHKRGIRDGRITKLDIFTNTSIPGVRRGCAGSGGRTYKWLYDSRDAYIGSGWDGEDVPPDALLDKILAIFPNEDVNSEETKPGRTDTDQTTGVSG